MFAGQKTQLVVLDSNPFIYTHVCHLAKFQYFGPLAKILILIIFKKSWLLTLENFETLRFLRGPKGGFPTNFQKKNFAKNYAIQLQ